MSYDEHSLRVEVLTIWSAALRGAIVRYWLFGVLWLFWARDLWEGLLVLLVPPLLGFVCDRVLLWRARCHVRQMRALVDSLR